MIARSHSAGAALATLLFGPTVHGIVLSPRHLAFGGYAVSLTEPLAPRMPNGIECAAVARPSDPVAIGHGRLVIGRTAIDPGPSWDPRPSFPPLPSLPPGPEPRLEMFAGWGPGLTPAGDDLIAGYVAGLVLLHDLRGQATRIAEEAALKTTALSATLLRHAASGEVPEPVHTLLATGDPRPLLAFGHSSGHWWLRGLISAGLPLNPLIVAPAPAGSLAS